MAKSNRKPDALVEPFQPDLHRQAEGQIASGEAIITEAGRFWSHRLEAYASYFDNLARCGSFADLARVQATFWTDLQSDYINSGATLISTATLTPLPRFSQIATPLAQPLAEA